ncbi:hypothetical protein HY375_03125 [Candidatus Berkelbacteria bacterium]|nr:hypothetical protein [Candidatus Berkelbacteria bacterium]
MDLQARLQVAKQAAFVSGDELRRHFDSGRGVREAVLDAGQAQRASLDAITVFLSQIYPDEPLWGRGFGETPPGKTFWLVDPLNGADGFKTGDERYATTVAWVENGQPLIGVVSLPSRRHLYWAIQGGGAKYQDRTLAVRSAGSLEDSVVEVVIGSQPHRAASLQALTAVARFAYQVTAHVSPALGICSVAEATRDAFIGHELHAWDWVAAKLILEEAGGQMTDLEGQPMKLGSPSGLASHPKHHANFLKHLSQG